jgi:hypothetical protein
MSPQKKQRRGLDDSLAQDFVFGGDTAAPPPKPKPSAKPPKPEQDDEKTIRFTADLPESLHQKLSILAARTGKKKVAIVRELLTEALKDVQ